MILHKSLILADLVLKKHFYLPHVKIPNFTTEKKHVYSLEQKVVLVFIAYFALHDNCEGAELFFESLCLLFTSTFPSQEG